MTDLVERLRAEIGHLREIIHAGADEIEKLRDENKMLRDDELLEIERLRMALREALPHLDDNYRGLRDMQADPARILAADAVLGAVRAALGEPKP